MHDILQDALDELVSSRTSLSEKGDALVAIEHVLAETCDPRVEGLLGYFNALQDTFQCNVSSRIIAWVAITTTQLEACLNRGSTDREKKSETLTLAAQLTQAMAIVQGVALTHKASKQYLGRRYSLEVLLDLLMVSRHLNSTSTPFSTPTSPKAGAPSAPPCRPTDIPLASVVIDTLLCILVDSVPALRVFEALNGVQVIVKILKRAGTPREVRMKCLEFLYFYLLDETTVPEDSHDLSVSAFTTPETTPVHSPVPPHRSYPSVSVSSEASYTTATSSRSSSASSAFSIASTSTAATSRSLHEMTASQNAELRPPKPSAQTPSPPVPPSRKSVIPGLVPSQRIVTPPSGSNALNALGRGQPRSLLMLRKEVDFIPLSPKKPEIAHLGHRASGLRPKLSGLGNVGTKLRNAADVLSSEETEGEEPAARSAAPSTPRTRPSTHSRGFSVSSASSLSSLSSTSTTSTTAEEPKPSTPRAARAVLDNTRKSKEFQTPRPASKLHRRTQSLADVMTESPARLPGPATELGAGLKVGPRSASSPTAAAVGSTKVGPRTMEEKKEILGSMLGNVDALVEGVRKAGIWGLN
ncbi:cell division control protein 14, SIN component-domain-containing protein [Trametes meyenii]|nr:cell division control protein 14, SIN component-domain-containing protein [Trametes meyenii]